MRRAVALLLAACATEPEMPSQSEVPAPVPTADTSSDDTGTPAAIEVIDGPHYGVPEDAEALLVGEVRLTTDVPTTATLHIDGPCGRDSVVFPETTEHVLPVLGLHHDAEHLLSVDLSAGGITRTVDIGSVRTPALDLPPITANVHHPDRMEPGLLVVTPYEAGGAEGWVVALDPALHVVYALPRKVEDLSFTQDGRWLAAHDDALVWWDGFGRELDRWNNDEDHRVHHEAFPLSDGGALTLAGGTAVADQPDDVSLQTTSEHEIIAQSIVRFDATGAIVERHRLAELLDPSHVGYLSLLGGDPRDWSHANAVVPWDDDGYLVSVRHLDVLACVNRDGTLRWLLGDPAGWRSPWVERFLVPTDPDLLWLRHPHAPEVHPDGLVWLFDNRNFGGSPYAPAEDHELVSRALALQVDEASGTFTEVASLTYDDLFSPAQGDADLLPTTGNVLLVYSVTERLPTRSRVVQLHPDSPDDPALDLTIGGDIARYVYRAEVLPSLYPSR